MRKKEAETERDRDSEKERESIRELEQDSILTQRMYVAKAIDENQPGNVLQVQSPGPTLNPVNHSV